MSDQLSLDQILLGPPQGDDQQSYDVAGGPGSGRKADRAIYEYQSIFDKTPPKVTPQPLQVAPPGFQLDEQGNYSRVKTGYLPGALTYG